MSPDDDAEAWENEQVYRDAWSPWTDADNPDPEEED